ncbi:transposase IS116/IS110/IS902 family protein, partial [marine sediment metagenome]
MRWDERTRSYVDRRTAQGLSKKDIMRCLKRHIAREIYHALINDLQARDPAPKHRPPPTSPKPLDIHRS